MSTTTTVSAYGTCTDCGTRFPMHLIDRPASERECPAASERDRITGQHGHRVRTEAYDAWREAGSPMPLEVPATFTIHPDLDVTQANGAPSAQVYGQCQAATTLARCMGSRVAYTEVDGNRWRMERQEGTDVWVAIDMTALAAFAL